MHKVPRMHALPTRFLRQLYLRARGTRVRERDAGLTVVTPCLLSSYVLPPQSRSASRRSVDRRSVLVPARSWPPTSAPALRVDNSEVPCSVCHRVGAPGCAALAPSMDARTRRSCVAGSGRERGGVCVGRGGELTVVVRQLTHVRCPFRSRARLKSQSLSW